MIRILRMYRQAAACFVLGLMTCAVGAPIAVGQVIYNSGAAHLLDQDHSAPNGNPMEGVLVEGGTTLTIRDINTNGQPAIGGIGYTLVRQDFGNSEDLIVAAINTSTVNIEGGTFTSGPFRPNGGHLRLVAFDDARLSISGGRFTTERGNSLSALNTSSIQMTGGTFISDRSNNLGAFQEGDFVVDGGVFTTLNANSFNSFHATDDSTFTVIGGDFMPAAHNSIRQFGASILNIVGGNFQAPDGQNSALSQNTGTVNITGGVFSATGGRFSLRPNFLQADDDSQFNIRGGNFTGETFLNVRFNGVMNVRGGIFPSDSSMHLGERFSANAVFDNESPQIHIYGTGFALDGVMLDFASNDTFILFDFDGTDDTIGLLDGTDVLTGTFINGTPFSLNIEPHSLNDRDLGGQILLHVPEPASIALFVLVSGAIVSRRR